MDRLSLPRLPTLLLGLTLVFGGCRCEPDLPELAESAAGGTLTLVEAANPSGGSVATSGGSDLTVPPREGDLGWWVDLASAPDGTLHLAYTDAFNGELHHAERVGETWKITVIDHYGAVGKYPALAVDQGGRPHILYYNQDKTRLMYATRVGAEKVDPEDRRRPFQGAPDWLFEVVDDGEEVGMAAQLRAMSDGTIHALYYTAKEAFIHLVRPAGPLGEHQHWKRRVVDDKAGGSHSIVVGFLQGPDGTLHASYANWTVFDSTLRYATLAPGADDWSHETLVTPANAGWKSGLVLGPADEGSVPQIAYLTLRNRRIVLATRQSDGSWKHDHLVGSANTMELVGGAGGALYLPHEHLPGVGMADARLRLVSREAPGKDWKITNFGPRGSMASYLGATVLPSGQLVVAWYDGGVRGVKLWIDDPPAP